MAAPVLDSWVSSLGILPVPALPRWRLAVGPFLYTPTGLHPYRNTLADGHGEWSDPGVDESGGIFDRGVCRLARHSGRPTRQFD